MYQDAVFQQMLHFFCKELITLGEWGGVSRGRIREDKELLRTPVQVNGQNRRRVKEERGNGT